MPANWSNPTITSPYATGVLQVIDERLDDAVSLFHTDGTNIPDNSLKYHRTNNVFQERISGAWVDKILSVAGGGTGSANASGARSNLGLGSLATQNDNAVAITGGTISGLTSLGVSGIATATSFSGSGASLTSLNASNISSGTVPTANLGGGTANSGTFLRGDSQWVAVPSGVPSGLIGMFDVACPAGWTRFTPLDGRYPKGAAAYGATGGANTHTHTAGSLVADSHTHSSGSYEAASHNHGGSTGSGGSHSHTFSDSGTTSAESESSPEVGSGSGMLVAEDNHHHNFSVSGTTSSHSGHSHSLSSSSPSVSGTSGSTAPGINGSTASASSEPLYLEVVWCKKD